MKNLITIASLALALLTPVALFAQSDFPNNYREVSTILERKNCAGVIITRYESPDYKLNEYTLPNSDIIFVLVPTNSDQKTYLKKNTSVRIVPLPFNEAKILYEQALNLPVPDAIPICTKLPNK